jgi:hypothetical protein
LTRTAVVLTINDSPEPPASNGDITECEADPVQTLDANNALSSTVGVTWYDAAVGGSNRSNTDLKCRRKCNLFMQSLTMEPVAV